MNGISFPTNCSGGIYMSGNRRLLKVHDGGEGGIRTHDTLAGMPHFECDVRPALIFLFLPPAAGFR